MCRNGRHFIATLSSGSDLLDTIASICLEKSIDRAVFSVTGSVTTATIGVFDPAQQVYVTHIEKTATEMLSCIGNVMQQDGSPRITAKIILADTQGHLTGGHLFSRTIIANGEMEIQELMGTPLQRTYQEKTGLSQSL